MKKTKVTLCAACFIETRAIISLLKMTFAEYFKKIEKLSIFICYLHAS